jgi:GTPase SAR1 family protein
MGMIPKEPTPPSTRMADYSWLFYGNVGVGKTTLANQFPSPVFIATEQGTTAMHAASIPIGNWQDMKLVLDALKTEKHGYKTVILDTVDVAYALCSTYVCEANGWTDVADGDWGRGWRAVDREWTNMLAKLRTLPVCTVFIGHEKSEEIVERIGSKDMATGRQKITSALPKSARGTLHAAMDFILRCELTENSQRILRTQPVENKRERIEVKARGHEGAMLPETVEMSFPALQDSFRNSFVKEQENNG